MKELKTISDEKLLRQIQSGNDDAMECLLERYRDMVRKEARSFFLAGGDEEDLIQEGMIGLFKAVTSYQEEKNTSFSTFAYLCVQRQIYTTITAFNRKKHIPLNTAISLFEQKNQEEIVFNSFILYFPSRCLTTSNARTPAATEAFSESISPFIGIDEIKSHFSFTKRLTPLPSFPITSPIDPVRF